ncbi:glycosyltransferase [Aeromonas popoffii]|uniref:glycosyltransferase n=1 Tax=Aeromonas popoffii TaxID=70856 RepID=UPI0030D0B330
MKKICVLLASYNGEKYLKEQIDSILCQLDVDVTIYVSLDKSSDNSLSMLTEFATANENIILLEYGHKFGSAGRNFFHLIKSVSVDDYDYIAFADQDDIWESTKIREAIILLSNSRSDGYSSNVTAFWENGSERLINKSSPQVEYDYLFESPGPGCTFVFTKTLYKKIQDSVIRNYDYIHKLWLHDWFCYSLARFSGYKWVIDPRPLMRYRQHSTNEVGANSGILSFLKRINIMCDGRGLNYVVQQAEFIGQKHCLPISYLYQGRVGLFKLVLISFKLRRKYSDKVFCIILFLILAIRGNSKFLETGEVK